jgi:hypothetical protein
MKEMHISKAAAKIGGALIGAATLGLGLPSIAAAQTQAPNAAPMYSPAQAGGALSQRRQLDRLQMYGFLNPNDIYVQHADPSQVSALGPVPQRKLEATLDSVQVNEPFGFAGPDSLRAYLANKGIAPSSIVGVAVAPHGVVTILHS